MLLALKLTLAPALVAAVSGAARLWGQRVGGFLAGLPIVAAPILLVLALGHGAAFGASAAASCAYGVCSLALFCAVYAHVCRWLPFYLTAPLGWAAVLLAGALFQRLPTAPRFTTAAVAASVTLVLVTLPRLPPPERALRLPAWDLPLRMAVTAALVLTLTGVSDWLGPRWSGLLAPFPVATSVLAVFAHVQGGPRACVQLLRGLVSGLYSFGVYCIVLGVLLRDGGIAIACFGAVVATLACHGSVWWLASRSART